MNIYIYIIGLIIGLFFFLISYKKRKDETLRKAFITFGVVFIFPSLIFLIIYSLVYLL